MQISISGIKGDFWISDGRNEHGPFETMLDASWTAIDMVTDRINSIPGVAIHFFALEING